MPHALRQAAKLAAQTFDEHWEVARSPRNAWDASDNFGNTSGSRKACSVLAKRAGLQEGPPPTQKLPSTWMRLQWFQGFQPRGSKAPKGPKFQSDSKGLKRALRASKCGSRGPQRLQRVVKRIPRVLGVQGFSILRCVSKVFERNPRVVI